MEQIKYIRQLNSFKNFEQDINQNRLFHSIMLINKDDDFLYRYAKELAVLILSSGASNPQDTAIKVEKEVHPDLFIYGKDKSIDVSVAKDIVSSVYISPYEGEKKVYIINKFDEILASPANKLLKTLEEPPMGVTFVLLVKNTSKVLQTLLSRAQKFYLEGFSSRVVQAVLDAEGVKDASILSLEADGSLALARKLSKNGSARKMANFVLNIYKDFRLTAQLANTLSEVDDFKGNEKELLSFFAFVADLILRNRANLQIVIGDEIKNIINSLAFMWNERALVEIIEASIRGQKMLEANVSVSNVFDQFFLKILEVRRKCRV